MDIYIYIANSGIWKYSHVYIMYSVSVVMVDIRYLVITSSGNDVISEIRKLPVLKLDVKNVQLWWLMMSFIFYLNVSQVTRYSHM